MVLRSLAMTQNAGPEAGRENAQRTYDRRRARSAADTLATIPPNRWDAHTRSVIATLATLSAPSAVDQLLAGTALDDDAEPFVVELDVDAYERQRRALRAAEELAQPAWTPGWLDLPDGTEDIREAFAAELDRMGVTAEEADDERERDEQAAADDATCRRQHQHGTPELAAACDALEGPFTPVDPPECECGRYQGCDKCGRYRPRVHDNGVDYHA